jgi:hypothetical protein
MTFVPVGLCGRCVHHRIIENRRGSRFHMCARALTDRRFAKYPPLPVLRCPGYEPVDAKGAPGERAEADPSGGPEGDGHQGE